MDTKPKAVIAIGIKPDSDAADETSEGVDVPEPHGWSWPNGVDPKEGDKFMCSIKQGPDGKLTITDIDGLPMGESDSEDTDVEPDDAPMSAMDAFSKGKASLMGS